MTIAAQLTTDYGGYIVPLVEDMLEQTAPVSVTYRGNIYNIRYYPERYTDPVHRRLAELRAASDFVPLNPMLVDLLAEWNIDRIKRDGEGNPLDILGAVLVNRTEQAPAIERVPITVDEVGKLSCFLRMALVDGICDDVMASVGNARGTSSGTRPAAGSAGSPDVPAGAIPAQPGSAAPASPATTPGSTPALVTVPSLETRTTTAS